MVTTRRLQQKLGNGCCLFSKPAPMPPPQEVLLLRRMFPDGHVPRIGWALVWPDPAEIEIAGSSLSPAAQCGPFMGK
jgi:hypothetical protein